MQTSIARRKQNASFRIVGSMLTIAPLWLMLAAANTSAWAQASDDVSNSSTATTASSPADWTQFLRDNMQRWNPYETVLGAGNVGNLQVQWRIPGVPNNSYGQSPPAVANGVVYFSGGGDGSVHALNAMNGAQLWSSHIAGILRTSPAVANGAVYVGSEDYNTMYALNASTGALLWSYTTGNYVDSSPTVVNGVVYFGSGDHNVYALNASTGAKLWSYLADVCGGKFSVELGCFWKVAGDAKSNN